ncbi:fibrinogen-like protein 1, partial [Gigantopelta aegis]|uniref:fibrinogen-like protein 1 n=1 Tax=Gigantopelta aegis TaxID=1735272 RepID=UPI001B88D51D
MLLLGGNYTNGKYKVYPRDNGRHIDVWCDNGWLVIQRRKNGWEHFFASWNDYKVRIGDLIKEFWLGNRDIHRITSQGNYELRIDMDNDYALYKNFTIASEEDDFRLHVGSYSGTA